MIQIMFETADVPSRVIQVRAGETIFRQGARSMAIFRLKSGRVRLARTLRDGTEVTIAVAGPGVSFAEAALFSERYHCDAIAEVDSEVLAFSCSALRRRFARDPQFARELAAFLARQVRELRSQLEIRNIKLANERIIAWLRLTASGKPPAVRLNRPWSAIAAEIGLTPEATYRALAELERTGRILRADKRTIILGR